MKNSISIIQDQLGFIKTNRVIISERMGISQEELLILANHKTSNSQGRTAIVQIPYIHTNCVMASGCNLLESSTLPLSTLLDPVVDRKFQKSMDISTLVSLTGNPTYNELFSRDGFGYVSENIRQGLRHRVKLLVLDSRIELEELTVLTVKISDNQGRKNTYTVVPIIQFYNIDDADVTLTDKLATINISRGRQNQYEERKVDVFTFKFRLKKESPNVGEIVKLIELIKMALRLDLVCLEVYQELILG
jgi:hypothetical protein